MSGGKTSKRKRPVVALALGSGGAKGAAHIGVLEVFLKNKIPVDIVTGSSMGAIVGGLFAAGISPKDMEEFACNVKISQIVDVGIRNAHGFVKGNRAFKLLCKFLETNNAPENFEDLKTKFGCASIDLISGEVKYFTKGNLASAIRASYSIPGIFRPVKKDKMLLVDGGPLCRIPIRLAKQLGADIVIAVDATGKTRAIKEETLEKYSQTVQRVFMMLEYAASRDEIAEADILIDIDQPDIDALNTKHVQDAIENGRVAARAAVDEIKRILAGEK